MFIQHDAIQVKIETTWNYKLITDNSKKYKNIHRNDKHHIQKNVTSGAGGREEKAIRKKEKASVASVTFYLYNKWEK